MAESLQFHQDGDCLWITPRATHADLSGTSEMVALKAELDRSGIVRLIIDLSALSHFGTNLLGFLVLLWRQVVRGNGRLILYKPSPLGREVLAISQLDRLWPIASTREEAVRLVHEVDAESSSSLSIDV